MNPISEQDFGLLADAVRRRRLATATPDVADALERHSFAVMAFVDDLAEGESVNAMDYQVVRAAAILHDAAATKTRPPATAAVSGELADELLSSIGADPGFVDAVAEAVRRHAGARLLDVDGGEPFEELETCPQMLVHDACLLARLSATSLDGDVDVEATLRRMREASAALCTKTARRIAATLVGAAERAPAVG